MLQNTFPRNYVQWFKRIRRKGTDIYDFEFQIQNLDKWIPLRILRVKLVLEDQSILLDEEYTSNPIIITWKEYYERKFEIVSKFASPKIDELGSIIEMDIDYTKGILNLSKHKKDLTMRKKEMPKYVIFSGLILAFSIIVLSFFNLTPVFSILLILGWGIWISTIIVITLIEVRILRKTEKFLAQRTSNPSNLSVS